MSNNRTRGQERQDELDVSPAALAAQIEQLMGELDAARKEAEDFKAGKVDVMFFAMGSPQVKEAAAALGGLRVLEVDASAQAAKRMEDVLPGAYTINVSPSPATDGVTKPTSYFTPSGKCAYLNWRRFLCVGS